MTFFGKLWKRVSPKPKITVYQMVIELGQLDDGYQEVIRILSSYPHTGIVAGDNLISVTYSAPEARTIAMGAIVKRVGEDKIGYYHR